MELKDETRHRTCTCTGTGTGTGRPVRLQYSVVSTVRAIFITLLELLHLVWILVSTEPWGNMDYNSIGTLDLSSLWLCDVAAP